MDRDEWDRRYAGADLIWTAQASQFVVAEIQTLPPGRALDLACGEGRNAVWLAEQGWKVTAVDFSAVGLQKGEVLARSRQVEVEWVEADLVRWTPPAGRYDLVLVVYLHLPWAELAAVLDQAAVALAPGGLLLVVGHDRDNIEHGYGGPPVPEILYDSGRLADHLAANLTVERAEIVERVVRTDDGDRVALDALVRARLGTARS